MDMSFSNQIPFLIFFIGFILFLALAIKAFFKKIQISPIAGFILLGWAIRLFEEYFQFLPKEVDNIINFLAKIGLVILLFHIGLESKIKNLIHQIKRAYSVAFFNIVISGLFGFYACYFLGFSILTSLFVAVAMTATSIGIVVTLWDEAKALKTKNGKILIDLVVIDDVIGILLLGMLLSVSKMMLVNGSISHIAIAKDMGITLLKMTGFLLFCYLFAHFVEEKLIRFVKKTEIKPDPMISVCAIGFIIASIAAYLGFSFAIGAFFAGLAFSRDPKAIKMDSSLTSLLDFFAPFFFIGIGFAISWQAISTQYIVLGALLFAAVFGKWLGSVIPARMIGISFLGSTLLGLSMIPRAEIAMVIMQQGMQISDKIISLNIYSSMAMVVLFTAVVIPVVVKQLLKKKAYRK